MVRVRCYFVKLWDLSEYSEKTNIQEAYLPKTSLSGQIVSEILAQLFKMAAPAKFESENKRF